MGFARVFQSFIEKSPVSVMFRGTLENVLAAERLDRLFAESAEKQRADQLAFSTCAELLGLVVIREQKSVHAAYRRAKVAVSVQSLYNKLAKIEPVVSEALVRETARDLAAIIDKMQATLPGPLPGFEVRIVDGNHLAGTQHRLKELRCVGDAALPGHTLAVLDPQRELIEELVVCEDGHANQKPLFHRLLDQVQPRQCWIADRDFSTRAFLFGVKRRRGYFVIRQHAGLPVERRGRLRRVGTTDTGVVYEQKVRLTDENGDSFELRRITIKLHQPTRDKETEIHLLSNLPKRVSAGDIAQAYLSRWQIEAAFQKLTQVLRCELNTLGYPDAALFGFSLAVVMYNAVSTVLAALRKAHPQVGAKVDRTGKRQKFSFYYIADEISGVSRGMAVVIPPEAWTREFAGQTTRQMANKLLWLARKLEVEPFLTNPCSVKKRKARRPIKHGGHVSTFRILRKRKTLAKK